MEIGVTLHSNFGFTKIPECKTLKCKERDYTILRTLVKCLTVESPEGREGQKRRCYHLTKKDKNVENDIREPIQYKGENLF